MQNPTEYLAVVTDVPDYRIIEIHVPKLLYSATSSQNIIFIKENSM